MDRNQAIGLVLISAIMMLYFIYFGGQQEVPKKQTTPTKTETTQTSGNNSPALIDTTKLGDFSVVAKGEGKEDSLSNNKIQIIFNSKGGLIERVWLKNFLTYQKEPLYLINKNNNKMDFYIPSTKGEINFKDLFFTPTKTDSSITFKAEITPGKYVEQVYKLSPDSYIVNYELRLIGLDNLVKNDPVKFNWNLQLQRTEGDVKLSREKSTVNYYTIEDGYDHLSVSNDPQEKNLETAVKWISLKERFFCAGIIADNSFSSARVRSMVNSADTTYIKDYIANINIPMGDVKTGKANFRFYFGPNRFQTLNAVTPGFHKNVDLGWPVINFINRFIVIPVFHFLEGFISNYGIIIIILVFLIKLLLFPLSYKSYIAMAKMKVLKPEIDEIKEKYGDDMQKSQMETMDLYRKVGINPLSGCIPVVLQMPILLAMFNFFPNSIELRQQSFLWAHDLSTYDAPIMLPFTIPFYGNHVSLFTLLMTLSTIAYTWFNNQVSTVTGPMKTVSYVMPVVFMFVLNSFPAGLSFYYFVSNLVTIGQQVIIRNFVDEDKIRKTLEENKKKSAANPNKKSRWMQRMEDAMKEQEKRQKNGGSKKKK